MVKTEKENREKMLIKQNKNVYSLNFTCRNFYAIKNPKEAIIRSIRRKILRKVNQLIFNSFFQFSVLQPCQNILYDIAKPIMSPCVCHVNLILCRKKSSFVKNFFFFNVIACSSRERFFSFQVK